MITVAPNSGCSAISKISDDIKAHPNPLNRASAGFLKGAVELVSGLAEGGVNLTQVGLEELEVFGDMLQGNNPSQWKMADISGMLETEKQLARLALGTVTSNVFFDASIVLDGLPQRGNVGSIQKELRLDRQMSENFWQETSKSIAEAFKEDPAQATGCAVFEVGLLLFPWAKSGKLGETTKGAEMLNDVDKLSDGANLLQRLSKSTGFGDDLTAANQLKTFNQGLKEFSQAAKANLSKEALEDLGENLRNLTFQVPSQEFALEGAGTTGKIKGIGEFLDEAKLNVQRFATSSDDDVAKVSGKLDEVGNVESKVGSVADEGTKIIEKLKREVPVGQQIEKGLYGRKQLLPEVKFTTENGYKYETDNLRRIESVEVNELKLKHGTRNQYSQRMVGGLDRLPDDDGGHLIATMFNGSGDIDNLVAMNKDINRNGGVWYEIEQEWKNALQEIPPKKVSVSIEPIYKGESLRPMQFEVNYSIEGQRSVEITIKKQTWRIKNMFNELNALYKEVAQLVNDMIPDKWAKFVLNAEMDKTGSGTVYFFFKHQDKVSYSLEIPAEYRIDRKVFKKLNRELYDLVWKIKQIFLKENFGDWFSMILQVDENQEMRIDFDYTDWFNTEYGPSSRIDFVEYKYFDKKPSNDKEAKLLEEMEAFQAASK